MEEEKDKLDEHKPGAAGIILEHKYLIISSLILLVTFMFKDQIIKDFIIFSVIVSVLIFFFSLFFELPRSRYVILQLVGRFAWAVALLAAIFGGASRWISTE